MRISPLDASERNKIGKKIIKCVSRVRPCVFVAGAAKYGQSVSRLDLCELKASPTVCKLPVSLFLSGAFAFPCVSHLSFAFRLTEWAWERKRSSSLLVGTFRLRIQQKRQQTLLRTNTRCEFFLFIFFLLRFYTVNRPLTPGQTGFCWVSSPVLANFTKPHKMREVYKKKENKEINKHVRYRK